MSLHDRPASCDAESLLGQAAGDFVERINRGEQPRIEEYLARYPEIAELIREIFPTLGAIGKSSAGPAVGVSAKGVPERIGDFHIIRELGRGGMGIVYEAHQQSMDRKVALKILPLACMLDEKRLARFRNEVRAAAALNHPNIVAVYSVGEERGIHYYAMQLVSGQTTAQVVEHLRAQSFRLSADSLSRAVAASSDERCATDQADAATNGGLDETANRVNRARETSATQARPDYYRSVARLGRQVADALHHAHEHGVIHRDIKPANLLLDSEGQIWITDFGLARIEQDAGMTVSGDLLGTVRYMAPEQASGSPAIVDHRADIYALGVTLYEIATLQPAISGTDHREMLKQVTQHDPVSPRKLAPSMPVELATIISKAIEKNPTDRYPTASALADDLGRFLDDIPIQAKPPTLVERAVKWSRRHSDLAWLAVAALLVGIIGSAAAAVMISRLYRDSETHRSLAERHRQVLRRELYALNMQQAFDAWNNDRTDEVQRILRRQVPAADEDDLRTFPWYALQSLSTRPPLIVMRGHEGPVREVAVHPDGRRIVSVGDDGTIRTWDVTSGQLLGTIQASENSLNALAISPDGKTVATGYNTLSRWDLDAATRVDRLAEFETTIEEAIFSPDGQFLIAGSRDQPALIIALDDKSVHTIQTNTGNESFAFTNQGRTISAVSTVDEQRRLRSWNIATGELVHDVEPVRGNANLVVATSRSGYVLVGSSGSGRIWLQYSELARPLGANVPYLPAKLMDLALSPDESHLVAACSDGMLRIWWLNTSWTAESPKTFQFRASTPVPAHEGSITSIAFLADGRAVSCGEDGLIKVWTFNESTASDQELGEATSRACLTHDASHLLCYKRSGVLESSSLVTGDVRWTVPYPDRGVEAIESSPDGRQFLTADSNHEITVWNRNDGRAAASVYDENEVRDLALSPNGKWLAATATDGYSSVWNTDTCKKVFDHKLASWGRAVEFSPDGRLMAVAGSARDILIVDTLSWSIARRLRALVDVRALAFHPSRQLLASAHEDATIRVWNLTTGEMVRALEGQSFGAVYCLVFHPSGKTLVSSGADEMIRYWDMTTWRCLGAHNLPRHTYATQIAFSPDGGTMATLMENQKTHQFALRAISTSMPPGPQR